MTAADLDQAVRPPKADRVADFKYRYPARYLVSWLATLAVVVVVLAVAPTTFSEVSLRLVTTLTGILVLASLGQMMVIMLGAIDLSVPAVIGLSAALLVHFSDSRGTGAAIVIALGGCAFVGAVNGTLVALLRLNALIVTLATNGIVSGLMLVKFGQKFSDTGQTPRALQDLTNVNFGPINLLLLFAIAVSVLGALYLSRTRFGRQVAAVGSNRTAAHLLGMPVVRVEVTAFALAGLLYGLAGIALASWVGVPGSSIGAQYALSTITAVAVAGAILSGGPASVSALNVAAFLLVVLGQALQILDLRAGAGSLVQGVILVLAVSVLTVTERGRGALDRLKRNLGALRS